MIRIEGVGQKFEDEWIFRDVSFTVPAQSSAVLIGPSGSGKSVLMKIVAGLITPSNGKVHIDSNNLGMLFQKNALFDSLTCEENLLFPLKEVLGETGAPAKKKANHLLEAVGLAGNNSLFPDEISGGMQKRLGIARALIVDPEVILYDEPTAGLDPITSRTIADLIRNLKTRVGSTVLAVTNDMQRAYQMGDQIYLLAKQTLIPGGTPEETQSTQNEWIRQFIFGLKQGPLSVEVGE